MSNFIKKKIRQQSNDAQRLDATNDRKLSETSKALKMYDEEEKRSNSEISKLISSQKNRSKSISERDLDESVFNTFEDTSRTVPSRAQKSSVESSRERTKISEQPKFSLIDLQNAIVLRKKLISWLGSPFWDWAIKNVYVVVKAFDSKAEYKIGQVLKTKKTHSYSVEDKDTDLELELKIGRTIKTFSMNHVSNTPLNEKHFENWINEMNRATVPLPSQENLQKIYEQIQKADNYTWTEEDVEKSIAKNKKKYVNITKRRLHLTQMLSSSNLTSEEREDVVNELKELDELDESRRKKIKQVDSQQLNINKISKEANKKRIANLKTIKRQRENTIDPFARIVTSDLPSFIPNKKRKIEQKDKNDTKVESIHYDFDFNIDLDNLGTSNGNNINFKHLVRQFYEAEPQDGSVKLSIHDLL